MIKKRWAAPLEEALTRHLPFLFRLPLSPNAMTACGGLVSLGAAVAYGSGALRTGSALVLLGGFFDLVDGVVARKRGCATPFGGLLDSTVDRFVDVALLAGLMTHYAASGALGWASVTAIALTGSVLVSYIKARGELEVPGLGVGLFERGERIGLLIAGGLLGLMPLALCVVALGSWATAGQRLALAHRKMQDRGEGAPESPSPPGQEEPG